VSAHDQDESWCWVQDATAAIGGETVICAGCRGSDLTCRAARLAWFRDRIAAVGAVESALQDAGISNLTVAVRARTYRGGVSDANARATVRRWIGGSNRSAICR
jgi:hypothetical protein